MDVKIAGRSIGRSPQQLTEIRGVDVKRDGTRQKTNFSDTVGQDMFIPLPRTRDWHQPKAEVGLQAAFLKAQSTTDSSSDSDPKNPLDEYILKKMQGPLALDKGKFFVFGDEDGPLDLLFEDFRSFEDRLGEHSVMRDLEKLDRPIMLMPLSEDIVNELGIRGANTLYAADLAIGRIKLYFVGVQLNHAESFAAIENELRETAWQHLLSGASENASYQSASAGLSHAISLIYHSPGSSLEQRWAIIRTKYNELIEPYERLHPNTQATPEQLQKAAAMLNTRLNLHGLNRGARDWEIRFAVVNERLEPVKVRIEPQRVL